MDYSGRGFPSLDIYVKEICILHLTNLFPVGKMFVEVMCHAHCSRSVFSLPELDIDVIYLVIFYVKRRQHRLKIGDEYFGRD